MKMLPPKCVMEKQKQEISPIKNVKVAKRKRRLSRCIRWEGPGMLQNVYGGKQPLHFASMFDDVHLIIQLLSAGANINATDDHGRSPLYYACFHGKTASASLLLLRGAQIFADGQGMMPGNVFHVDVPTSVCSTIATLISKEA
mmetsp:Transcript_809/g.1179  ORF Transcript_809/g.1179 Transcript_809/m.1179 type:complete len:143 (-) Transcript_809:186-614(-)